MTQNTKGLNSGLRDLAADEPDQGVESDPDEGEQPELEFHIGAEGRLFGAEVRADGDLPFLRFLNAVLCASSSMRTAAAALKRP